MGQKLYSICAADFKSQTITNENILQNFFLSAANEAFGLLELAAKLVEFEVLEMPKN